MTAHPRLSSVFNGLPFTDDLWAGILDGSPPPGPSTAPQAVLVTSKGNSDSLAFRSLPEADAVKCINTEFFVLRSSGKIYRHGPEGELTALSNQNFKTALGGRSVHLNSSNGTPKLRSAAEVWLASPDRREFTGMQYCPDDIGLKPSHLNLFTGWGSIAPIGGNCSFVLDHIHRIVADGNDAKGDYLVNWLADILQNPTRKPGVCIVLRGSQGTGKSVVGAIMRRLLGAKNVLTTSDKDRILGRFNSTVASKILLIGEEMLFAGDRATTDKLKHLITGDTIQIEIKFGELLEIGSHHRLLLTSNHHHVIQAAGEERRFLTYDVADAKRGDADYFDTLYSVADGRDDATAAAFMKHLLDRDLSGFSPWKAQQALAADTALARQKEFSLSAPLAWLHEVMNECAGQFRDREVEEVEWLVGLPIIYEYPSTRKCQWPPKILRRRFAEGFRAWTAKAKPYGASEFTGSQPKFWAEVHKVIPLAKTSSKDSDGNRLVAIDLADLRANFDKFLKGERI